MRFLSLLFVGFAGFACTNDTPEPDNGQEYSSEHAITQEEAVLLAAGFMQQQQEDNYHLSTLNKVVTVKDSTGKTRNEQIPLYQINYKDAQGLSAGYAVVVGDDRFEGKVIAFNNEGSCTVFSSPDAPFWTALIERYLHCVANGGKKKELPSLRAISLPDPNYAMVLGMLTQWRQSGFYSDCTRFIWNTNEVRWQRGLAGCIPVAMGTIMAWHKWPLKGIYKKEVDTSSTVERTIQTVTTSYTVQNWTDIYNSAPSHTNPTVLNNTHKAHIANLLAEIGYKLDMNYAWGVSTAYAADVAPVFRNMGYTCSNLTAYDIDEIVDEVYTNRRPVYMNAYNYTYGGGHAFVVNGIAWQDSQPAFIYLINGEGGSNNGWYSTSLTSFIGESMYADEDWKWSYHCEIISNIAKNPNNSGATTLFKTSHTPSNIPY
jgi:hypothetical protein